MISYCGHQHRAPDKNTFAIELNGLSARYPSANRLALEEVSLSVKSGSALALVGPNGAGKSTLFKVLTGLLPITKGIATIYGLPIGSCHHQVAYLSQKNDIDWHFPVSVFDFVLMGRYVYLGWFNKPSTNDRDIVSQALALLGIAYLAHEQIAALSGGQQQRVLIARALAQEANLLLLDEPLNAVDAKTREALMNALTVIKNQGKTIVMATHFIDPKDTLYDGSIYLKEGKLVTSSSILPGQEGCCHHD